MKCVWKISGIVSTRNIHTDQNHKFLIQIGEKMSFLARLYDCGNKKISLSDGHYRHSLERAPRMSRCARITNNLKWLISQPFILLHGAYNTARLAKDKELSAIVMDSVDYQRPFTPFPFLNMMLYIFHTGLPIVLNNPRHDPSDEGLFVDRVNHEVFLPVLKEIIDFLNDELDEQEVSREDFLFTCSPEQARYYRAVIIDFMGPKKQSTIRQALQDTTEWMISEMILDGNIENADAFCGTFTSAVISKLFLSHPGPKEMYEQIYWATQQIDKYVMQRRWSTLPEEQEREYQQAIAIIAGAIRVTLENKPPFVQAMESRGLTSIQQKGMLFLVYLAGASTTTSALKYVLWQLGQHPEYQERILEGESPDEQRKYLYKIIAEALRLAPPVGTASRFAAFDLKYSITDDTGKEVYSYIIPKGAGILAGQLVEALDERKFSNANVFNPERFDNTPRLSWLPFSKGFHECPGRTLALAELSTFVLSVIQRYHLSSSPNQPELRRHLFMTLSHPEKVSFLFTPR